jgi:hypothetical protein
MLALSGYCRRHPLNRRQNQLASLTGKAPIPSSQAAIRPYSMAVVIAKELLESARVISVLAHFR